MLMKAVICELFTRAGYETRHESEKSVRFWSKAAIALLLSFWMEISWFKGSFEEHYDPEKSFKVKSSSL